MKRTIFKRGDTFQLELSVSNNGEAVNLTGWTIASQVRSKSKLISTLAVEYTDRVLGIYRLRDNNTSDWPLGMLVCDIKYTTDDGQIVHSETFEIEVQRGITQ